jgi:hypothetical protein
LQRLTGNYKKRYMKENVYNVVKGCALCLKNVWMLLFVCLLLASCKDTDSSVKTFTLDKTDYENWDNLFRVERRRCTLWHRQ